MQTQSPVKPPRPGRSWRWVKTAQGPDLFLLLHRPTNPNAIRVLGLFGSALLMAGGACMKPACGPCLHFSAT
jgi:hypothetical protein